MKSPRRSVVAEAGVLRAPALLLPISSVQVAKAPANTPLPHFGHYCVYACRPSDNTFGRLISLTGSYPYATGYEPADDLHNHSPSQYLVETTYTYPVVTGQFCPYRTGAMQDLGYGFPRTLLLGNRVNKGSSPRVGCLNSHTSGFLTNCQ